MRTRITPNTDTFYAVVDIKDIYGEKGENRRKKRNRLRSFKTFGQKRSFKTFGRFDVINCTEKYFFI